MWRQNVFLQNPDSDHSISDEEDYDSNLPQISASLTGALEKKEELQVLSRLEILRGTSKWNCGKKSSKNDTHVSLEDEDVEMPEFRNEARKAFTCDLDEEIISDDEVNNVVSKFSDSSDAKKLHEDNLCRFGSGVQDGAQSWSAVSKEAEALLHLNENASTHSAYAKASKSYKGVRCRVKQKFSFRFQSCKEEPSWPSLSKDENDVSFEVHEAPERMDTFEPRSEEHSIAEVLDDCQRENQFQSENLHAEVGVLGHGCAEPSMAELLDGLQDRASLQKRVYKKCSRTKAKRVQIVAKKIISPLGDRTVDREDSSESMGSGSSSEDKATDQKLKVKIPEMKGQTMADRFQETLGATFLNDEGALVAVPKSSGIGLFGKLQQLMQNEKERDVDFLKKLQTGSDKISKTCDYEVSSIVVKILARFLDAKLIVCQCSFGENIESPTPSGSPQIMINGGRKTTIIFNPRVCSDVDLEVGNSICIHPPWKEVKAGNDESIVLSTYFSQIVS
ncbi:hypothetical protein RGQ29_008421 [Quercus rubra]|uniref:Uncharacterized protein n=1 Tax=Quercus rubra TaxID=3512 RepID=A0AAN7E033_QUERU|nr:hypothetical protein RGQ29_008421 [Quercus rubra]